eukprot:Clim_evm24s33 gene=Clim_evmTU24s33
MRCHYEVLGIEQTASEADIKKAYRKAALRCHPDKNLGREEEARREFQIIQVAYELLSDPRERRWYDQHRDEILSGHKLDKDDLPDIIRFFNPACYDGYDDASKESFYTVYRQAFSEILQFEKDFYDDEEYHGVPSFGDSNSSYEEVVKPFYVFWMAFNTRIPFAWADEYDVKWAPNRRVRRLIEKENNSAREAERKKYNEQIRHLAALVRKWDPRVKAAAERQAKLNEEKQQRARELAAEQRRQKRQQVEDFKNFKNAAFGDEGEIENKLDAIEDMHREMFGDSSDDESNEADDQEDQSDDEAEEEQTPEPESEQEDLYCAACDKEFKSAAALQAHEKNRKHRDNVAALRKQLATEEKQFKKEAKAAATTAKNAKSANPDDHNIPMMARSSKSKKKKGKKGPNFGFTTDMDDDDHVIHSADVLANEINTALTLDQDADDHQEDYSAGTGGKKKPRRRKEKSKKKPDVDLDSEDEERVAQGKDPSKVCNVCHETFPSRSKLFDHIQKTGHALHISAAPGKKNKKK